MYMDPTLTGKAHCKILASKPIRANGLLSKVRHYVIKEELKSIYHAIFSSHLSYGSHIWGQQGKYIETICKLQNRALRVINFEGFNTDPNPLFKRCNILKLQDMVKFQNILHVHDYLSKSLPECFQDDFSRLQDVYSTIHTRNSNLGCLFKPGRKTTRFGIYSISHKCICNWNTVTKQLNVNLAHLPRNKLKLLLKQHFLNSY